MQDIQEYNDLQDYTDLGDYKDFQDKNDEATKPNRYKRNRRKKVLLPNFAIDRQLFQKYVKKASKLSSEAVLQGKKEITISELIEQDLQSLIS